MRKRVHFAWVVVGVAFITLLGAAGYRSSPSVLMVPIQDEFGGPRAAVSAAISVNLLLFGLVAPFAASLIERFGLRRVASVGLLLIGLGAGLPVFITATWQLVFLWGVLVGAGAGSISLVFTASLANRWFVKHRGLVTGLLTAATATGQLIFLPVLAALAEERGWRTASLVVGTSTLLVVPLVLLFLRDRPSDKGLLPYGADASYTENREKPGNAIATLRMASRSRTFWLLVAGFAICGATTNGLIGTHFLPAAHDHGMAPTTAASLLALIGVFDIIGTVGSGWLTDRVDSRILLGVYYGLRGLSLLSLPLLLTGEVKPSLLIFVIFYGLDWIATVPPTVALCRENFGASGTIVFGWVFASHQIGAAIAALAAGAARDAFGDYITTWIFTGALAIVAAGLSVAIRALPSGVQDPVPAHA
ncbi:MFS transporter [Rhizocola hellebori]|uniref:MFS transporter n=1 Tax=Rhizocola hellebori TaxID=1392758 RepID=A0A8J3QGF8_9ACTN|nr:MFS transporter [Rhizocola hellebori]GIH09187.1 MFS transporter [Rhizocola hellebori]